MNKGNGDQFFEKAGMYGNRTHWELCSNPPMVLKTMANTSCANTPEGKVNQKNK